MGEIRRQKELDEDAIKKAELDVAFERCEFAEYVKNIDDFPHFIVLRKISGCIKSNDHGGCIRCYVHETVRIVSRKKVVGRSTDSITNVDYEKCVDTNIGFKLGFLEKSDYPITKEEFEKAKNFAIYIRNTVDDFIDTNPFLVK